jgi:hypothetical protein
MKAPQSFARGSARARIPPARRRSRTPAGRWQWWCRCRRLGRSASITRGRAVGNSTPSIRPDASQAMSRKLDPFRQTSALLARPPFLLTARLRQRSPSVSTRSGAI